MKALLIRQADKINRIRSRQSNTKLDLMKLYGIFCVVHAHTIYYGFSVSQYLTISSVYVIQLFMFCSGYFYRQDTDQTTFLPYLKKCARSYLLPYFTWNLLYGLVCQVLRLMGLITYGSDLSLYSFLVRPWTDAAQYSFNLPAWFLLALFLVAMLTWAVRHALSRRAPISKVTDHLLLAAFFLISIISMVLLGPEKHYGFKVALLRPLVLLPYYQMGLVYRHYWEGHGKRLLVAAVLLVIQLLLPVINGDSLLTYMIYGYFYGNPLLLMLAAATAVLLIAEICDLIAPFFKKFRAIHHMSRCTMYIMLHHLFIVFLIQFLFRIVNHFVALPGYNIGSFTHSQWYFYTFGHSKLQYVYLLIALLTPVLLHFVYEAAILTLAKKLRRHPAVTT